jgi:uncharacterized protein YfaS (alpha-2-macroglobulin family)
VPDDLTSWRLSATALSANLDAGDASILVPVGLDFFVEATLAPEYLAGEQPVLRLRAYGRALQTGDPVRFTVSAPSLGLAESSVDAKAFVAARVTLPKLTLGDHRIEIRASTPDGTAHDALIRTIHVVTSRVSAVERTVAPLTEGFTPPGGAGLSTYLITDAGRGALLPLLTALASTPSGRFDRLAASEAARRILTDAFGLQLDLPPTGFDAGNYQHGGGVALLPYGSASRELTLRAAYVVGRELDADVVRSVLYEDLDLRQTEFESGDPMEPIKDLAALAALGDDVLGQLATIGPRATGTEARIWLGLAYLAVGDDAAARASERAVLAEHGQTYGPWTRVDAGDDTLEATALMLMLAGGLGDPIAPSLARYLDEHPSADEVYPLEQLAYANAALERLPRAAGKFAWTAAGQRHEVTLEAGGSFSLALTADQRATFSVARIEGDMTVASVWLAPLAEHQFSSSGGLAITRQVSPAGETPADRLVRVTISVTFGKDRAGGCYRVTDSAPSGLVPLTAPGWPDADENGNPVVRGIGLPSTVVGQQVSWCADPANNVPLTYTARVVSPGTYTWEPAVIQLDAAPDIGATTDAETYTIR